MSGGKACGTVTSSGFGYRVGANIAYAFVDAALVENGAELQIRMLDRDVPAKIDKMCRYDPANEMMKSN